MKPLYDRRGFLCAELRKRVFKNNLCRLYIFLSFSSKINIGYELQTTACGNVTKI